VLAEHVLNLVEEPAVRGDVFDGHGFGELAQEFFLTLVELGGRGYADLDDEVTLAALVQMRDALGAEAELAAALGAFGDLDGGGAFESFDFKLGAERGLREGNGHNAVEVVPVSLEELVRLDREDDV
jgi:hypothetical protein